MTRKSSKKIFCCALSLAILFSQTICAADLTLPLVSINSPVIATPLIPSLSQSSPPAGSLQNPNHFVMNQSAGGKFQGVSPGGIYDGLGSVRQITDAAGAVIESYDYDVYGQPTTVSAIGNPAMFTGRWFDSESGLYYYRARYYSPTLGRFLQRDPIGYMAGMNLYSYVNNNPINYIDPDGETPVAVAILMGIALDYLYDEFAEEYVNDLLDHYLSCGQKEFVNMLGGLIGNLRMVKNPLRALSKGKEWHHLLPKEFRRYFEKAGLNIEKYLKQISKELHRLKPGGIHTGSNNWNKVWRNFFEGNPNAGKNQIRNQLKKMMKDFGIGGKQ